MVNSDISWVRVAALFGCLSFFSQAENIWIEGEQTSQQSVTRHPWWYDQVKKEKLSGGDFISHWAAGTDGTVSYSFAAKAQGAHDFYVRANPVQSRLFYSLNGSAKTEISFKAPEQTTNIAKDDKPDLRFMAWIKVGEVELKAGTNTVTFTFASENSHHGALDCFLFTNEGLHPVDIQKPGQLLAAKEQAKTNASVWFEFQPPTDPFGESPIDLRHLNEKTAGEKGWVTASGSDFVLGSGKKVRFWAVNGAGADAESPEDLRRAARRLAKYGVNMVRLHGAVFDEKGNYNPKAADHIRLTVAAMKQEGIYSHLSIYFPLWLNPAPGTPWLQGYDGGKHPFAALYFNPDFQQHYRDWWKQLLTTPDPATGRSLLEEPAVFGAELINEDSFFFWTFGYENVPAPQMRLLEAQFGAWAGSKYGSLDAAVSRWKSPPNEHDKITDGLLGFPPLWKIFNEKGLREQDTAAFLFETQQKFYSESIQYLRKLGFKGLVTPSNWTTASPEFLGPLEKLSYTVGDFVDRHGYFGAKVSGQNSEWSIRDGHIYRDRSAYRFEAEEEGKPKVFTHPAMDPSYNNLPSMISETTWNRPNRYRSEAPLYLAVYGALQGSDGIVHFAFDGADWSVKPGFWMQPWTLISPSMMGQFPVAAMVYRLGLVPEGEVLAKVRLNIDDLKALKGTPLPQDAAFDELRLKDVPKLGTVQSGQQIDPLIHYAGRAEVSFGTEPGSAEVKDLSAISRETKTVTGAAGSVRLDYGSGVLTVNRPGFQMAGGDLQAAGKIELADMTISSSLDLIQIAIVALDGGSMTTTKQILVQVMTEEQPAGWQTEPAAKGMQRITSIGHNPWMVRKIIGQIEFKHTSATHQKIQPLDWQGYPKGPARTGSTLTLDPETLYYLIDRQTNP